MILIYNTLFVPQSEQMKQYVTLKTSNSQKYIVWVKIYFSIYFLSIKIYLSIYFYVKNH